MLWHNSHISRSKKMTCRKGDIGSDQFWPIWHKWWKWGIFEWSNFVSKSSHEKKDEKKRSENRLVEEFMKIFFHWFQKLKNVMKWNENDEIVQTLKLCSCLPECTLFGIFGIFVIFSVFWCFFRKNFYFFLFFVFNDWKKKFIFFYFWNLFLKWNLFFYWVKCCADGCADDFGNDCILVFYFWNDESYEIYEIYWNYWFSAIQDLGLL